MNNISKEDFKQYVDIKATGKYDMNTCQTRMRSNLTHEEWWYCHNNFDRLNKRFKKEVTQ